MCITVYKNPRLRTTTNIYILALALSDLLSAVCVMPLAAGVLITGRWIFGAPGCEFHGFFSLFTLYVSPVTMGLTALNRFVRILKPSLYKKIFSSRLSKVLMVSVWLFVASYVAVPRILGIQTFGFMPGYAQCTVMHTSGVGKLVHYSLVVSLFVLLPLVTAILCYYRVFKAIKQHNLDVVPSLQNSNRQAKITRHEIRLSKSLFVVVVTFSLLWIPSWIVVILKRLHLVSHMPRNAELLYTFLIYSSNTINPLIYSGMNPSFRIECRRLLFVRRKTVAPLFNQRTRRKDISLENVSHGHANRKTGLATNNETLQDS